MLFLPSASNSFANRGGIFFHPLARHIAILDRRHFNVQIDPVEQRPRNSLAIALHLHRTAAAFAFEIAEISTRAGVHRRDQHEFAGKGEAAGCARDRYFSVLERLTHYFQGGSFELWQLIEKKDAIVGKAHFTRSRERSAAEQADVADGVMRRAKRPRRDKRFFAVEKSGNAVDLGGLDRFIKRHRRNNCWDPLR